MNSRRPDRSDKKNNAVQEQAQKSLDIILNYSRTARKSKEYVAHPQSILKDDLKRDFGCKTCSAAQQKDAQDQRPDGSIQSVKSNDVNAFIDKYICNNNDANQVSNTNIITLNQNEFVRLKAGGSFLSKLVTTPFVKSKREAKAKDDVKENKKVKDRDDVKDKQEAKAQKNDIKNERNVKIMKPHAIPLLAGSCCYEKLTKKKLMPVNEIRPMLNRMIDSVFDQHEDQQDSKELENKTEYIKELENKIEEELPPRPCCTDTPAPTPAATSESKVFEEKRIKFATPLISGEIKRSEHSLDTDSSYEPKPPRPIRTKLTIVDFDKIFHAELKKRRGKVIKGDLTHPAMKNNPCAMNVSLEPTSSVKAALIHSAVTGLPNDILFTEDYELMNAIDKFIQAENSCTFEEALRVAEIAAKMAPPGFEEEAAASAARNYQFQCNKEENFNTIPLDKKKKPIEIVAYVGSTKN